MVTYTQEEFHALQNRWNALKENKNLNAKDSIDLDPLLVELAKHIDNNTTSESGDTLDSASDLKQMLINFLKTLLDMHDPETNKNPNLPHSLNDKDLLKMGAILVKALDINNSRSKRSKKYLRLGIAAMLFGVVWIAGLIFGGIFLGPLTAFTITSTTTSIFGAATTTVTAIPVWAAALGGAAIPSLIATAVSLFKVAKNPSSGTLYDLGRMVFAIEPIGYAAIFLLAAISVCLLPIAPFIAGGVFLKKAHDLSKNPTGLALALAQSFPALAEKVHYGNANETRHAKLKKAEKKLKAFNDLKMNGSTGNNKNDVDYVNLGIQFYQMRISALKKEKPIREYSKDDATGYIAIQRENKINQNAAKKNLAEAKSKLLMAKNKNGVSDKVRNAVSVNDHRTDQNGQALEDATLKLSDSLKGTLFANHYDVKHAMKVEEAVRDQRKAAATARG